MRSFWFGLGLTAVFGLTACAIAKAQQFNPPPLPPVVKPVLPGLGSTNVIQGTGNGFGNSIIVSNSGGGPSSTIISNTRNGIGNQVVIMNDGKGVVIQDPPCYYGKNNAFWSMKIYCDKAGTDVFFCPKANEWYRYVPAEDVYRPVPPDLRPKLQMDIDRLINDLLSDF